jgi:hypothetical protein
MSRSPKSRTRIVVTAQVIATALSDHGFMPVWKSKTIDPLVQKI